MSSRLFIGGISFDTTESDLQEYFSSFGPINSCTIVYNRYTGISKGYGFLQIKGKNMAQRILSSDKHLIKGRLVDVSEALDINKSTPSHDLLTKGFRRLFVGGLSHKISTDHLLDYFSTFGRVLNVFKISDPITKVEKKFGYVEFETLETATIALNFKPHVLFGHRLNVQHHKSGLKASLLLNLKNKNILNKRDKEISNLLFQSPAGQIHRPASPIQLDSQSAETEDQLKSTPENNKLQAEPSRFKELPTNPPAEGKKSSRKFPENQDSFAKAKSSSLNTQSSEITHPRKPRYRIFYRHLRRLGALTSECPNAAENGTYSFNRETQLSHLRRVEHLMSRWQ